MIRWKEKKRIFDLSFKDDLNVILYFLNGMFLFQYSE